MKLTLFPFQEEAVKKLRALTAEALGAYERIHVPQIVSFTAPTGSGKTIIMSALMEDIYNGDEVYPDQRDAIFVWLSDSPQLNTQSRNKIDAKADRIQIGQCVTVEETSFDQDVFDDGHIYFLNTQKIRDNANLAKHGDNRTYTIWETIANTVREKSDRLYFIIDEAHRGMQDNEAGKATSIMQKFIKGSDEDGIGPMPVVIGMSATMGRFEKLVGRTTSTVLKWNIDVKKVRDSGLLKERIFIMYPDKGAEGNEMAVLQAAADDWKDKCDHWDLYCKEQHDSAVNPVFVVQVTNAKKGEISNTDLDECLRVIEARTGFHFVNGEVVHAFGDVDTSIKINGLDVKHKEPSDIADDSNIKVVFFKESLSTGWDCPRAETMMSFRHAADSTYIAQLLGRMIRTPKQRRIKVDDTLNNVHLFLPHFDKDTVGEIVQSLQDEEGKELPTDVEPDNMGNSSYDTLTVKKSHAGEQHAGQSGTSTDEGSATPAPSPDAPSVSPKLSSSSASKPDVPEDKPNDATKDHSPDKAEDNIPDKKIATSASFDGEEVVRFINDAGILTNVVRKTRRSSSYLSSLLSLVHILSESGIYASAVDDTHQDIVEQIHKYITDLVADGLYDDLVKQVMQFELQVQIFDIFGESVDEKEKRGMMVATDADIDRQYRLAQHKIGNDGLGEKYGDLYYDPDNPNKFKIDIILFALNDDCIKDLNSYADKKFHDMSDTYREEFAYSEPDKFQRQFDSIISDGDIVSEHTFRFPDVYQVPHDPDGKEYSDHLFINEKTGTARIKLNRWEEEVLAEEEKRDDFVCWVRNPSKASWALTVAYAKDGLMTPMHPDLLIIRKNDSSGSLPKYSIDVLEPHGPQISDNLGKAKGLAEYAERNPKIKRVQLIREMKNSAGKEEYARLDFAKKDIRDRVRQMTTDEELNRIFDEQIK